MASKHETLNINYSDADSLNMLVRRHERNNAYIIHILERMGRLPKHFDGSWLIGLLNSKNSNVRFLAVKNIGKLADESYLTALKKIAGNDADTNVRREAVSAIGRMRKPSSKQVLFTMLDDDDPKVVCQAVRGLLVFKGEADVDEYLLPLAGHQNEIVSAIIRKEYSVKKQGKSSYPHTECYDYLKNVVVHGDTIETMKLLKNESIHLTFTSPPYYNARDYSIYPSYKCYLEFLRDVFREVYRITKEGRFLIINTSPVIVPRISRAHSSKRYPIPFDIHHYIVDIGWEFIDDIIWEKPETSVKNRVGGFQQHRKPLGYKPNPVTEYVMVYRKSTEKLLDWNIRQYDGDIVESSKVNEDFETSNIWKIDPCFDKVHSAVFPVELCKRVIRYYSYKKDLIFDPFGGSGTVAKAAKMLDRYFFLTEKDDGYFSYMKSKITGELDDKYPPRFLSKEEFQETIP